MLALIRCKHNNMLVLPKQKFPKREKMNTSYSAVSNLGLEARKSWLEGQARPPKHFSIIQLHTCSKNFSSSGASNFFRTHHNAMLWNTFRRGIPDLCQKTFCIGNQPLYRVSKCLLYLQTIVQNHCPWFFYVKKNLGDSKEPRR